MNDIHRSFGMHGLVRPRERRVLGGVCAGLGRRFSIAPWPARILFVLLLMVNPRQPDPDLPGPVDPHAVGGDGQGRAAADPADRRLNLGMAMRGGYWLLERAISLLPIHQDVKVDEPVDISTSSARARVSRTVRHTEACSHLRSGS
jgi:hypothetical protein